MSQAKEPTHWQVLDSDTAFECPWLRVRRDRCRLPDASENDFFIVERRDVAVTLTITPEQRVVLNRQYRHAVAATLWEAQAGMIESGEDPAVAARRELEEETGYLATELIGIASPFLSSGFLNSRYYLFVATGATPTGTKEFDPSEEIYTQEFTFPQLEELMAADQIDDFATVSLLYAAQVHGYL